MAARKYPPQDDVGVLAAGNQFKDQATAPADIGLTADDMTRLNTAVSAAQASYDLHVESQTAARANRTAKDDNIQVLEELLSEFNQRIQPLTHITDQTRTELGLPVYDTTPTTADAPDELPVVKIDTAMPLLHTIYFSDADGKGKPEGVKEAEFYVKIGGDATGNVEDYRYLGRDTEAPYTKEFQATDAGKQAHYMIRWLNSKGEGGAYQLASATITSLVQNSGG